MNTLVSLLCLLYGIKHFQTYFAITIHSFKIFSGKPGRTGEPKIKDVQKNSAELVWSEPENDGGAPITNYVIEYCEEGMFKWHPANEGDTVIITRYNVKGLKENTAYKFRVAAENKGGVGPFSECAMAVKVQEPIGKLICHSVSLCSFPFTYLLRWWQLSGFALLMTELVDIHCNDVL